MSGEAVPAEDLPGAAPSPVPAEDLPGGEESKDRSRPLKGRMVNFVLQNINKGIASVPDAVLNAPTEAVNLLKAGAGVVAGAAGAKPENLPELYPNPNFVRRGMEKVGMLTPEGEATTPGQERGAMALQMAGGMLVPAGKPKPGAFKNMAADAEVAAGERAAQRADLDRVLKEGRQVGYVAPPSSVQSSLPGNAVEGLVARTAPTERLASMKNATVTNKVVRRDLGLTPTQPVTDSTFEAMRKDAGKAYQAVKESGVQIKPDETFTKALEKIKASDYQKAASEYADVGLSNDAVEKLVKGINKEVSPTAAVEMVKELRRRATKNLKAWDDLEKQDLGHAQRSAANAIEDLIERNLSAAGKKSVATEWKVARQKIAKTYDAEAAWDGTNFSAKELAKLMDRDVPLSGGMKQAAEFAKHFPRATQDATKLAQKSGWSQYDAWAGAGGYAALGPKGAAVAAVPWLTQRALLSPAGQRIFGTPNYGVSGGLRAASSLDEMIQRAALQGGIQAGQEE